MSLAVVSVLCLPWLLLMRNGVRSRQQQAEMTVAADAFFAQMTPQSRNASAQQFDRFGADLGFVPNDVRGLAYRIDPEAEEAFQAIEAPLNDFLNRQTTKVAGPLDPIPPVLSAYLSKSKPKLDAIRDHLLTAEAPQWEIDLAQMTEANYPFPGLVNTSNIQRLLLALAIDAQQRQQPGEMLNALEASWQLNQAIAQRPDLLSKISAAVIFEYQAGLLRHLETIPVRWQGRLGNQAMQPSIINGLEFDIWLQYGSLQKAFSRIVMPAGDRDSSPSSSSPNNSISHQIHRSAAYWFSPVHYFNLTNIDTARTAHRALKRLDGLTVCSTTQAAAEQRLSKEKTARWNEAIAPVPAVLAKRWKAAGDRALSSELTQKVLEAKQQAQANGQWPLTLPNSSSVACPKEQWIYTNDNSKISITLSTELSAEPTVPLSWQADTMQP